jgi:hypothetical protein
MQRGRVMNTRPPSFTEYAGGGTPRLAMSTVRYAAFSGAPVVFSLL